MDFTYEFAGQRYSVQVETAGDGFLVTVAGHAYAVRASLARAGELALELDGLRRCLAYVAAEGADRWVTLAAEASSGPGQTYRLTVPEPRRSLRPGGAAGQASLEAQMPGTVRQVLVVEGDQVARGQTLALLEAMKMEIRVTAHAAGVVTRVSITPGQTVERGQVLFALGPLPPAPG